MTAGPGGRRRRAPDPERVRALQNLAADRGLDVAGLAGAARVSTATARAWLLGLQLPGPAALAALAEQGLSGAAGPAGPRLPDILRAGLWPGRRVALVQRPRDQPDVELEILELSEDGVLEGIAHPSGRLVRWARATWRTLIRGRDRQPPPGYRAPVRVLDRGDVHRDAKPGKLSDPQLPPWPFRSKGEPLERSLVRGLEVAVFWPPLPARTAATRRTLVRMLRGRTRKVVRAVLLDPAQDWVFSSKHSPPQPFRNYPSRAMKWRGLAAAIDLGAGWLPAVLPLHHLITTWIEWIDRDAVGSRRPRHTHVDDHAAEFGQRLREVRQLAGLSLERAATLAQISPAILSHLENGHADTFRAVAWNLWPLAAALRCDPRDLFAPPATPLLKDDDMPATKPATAKLPYVGTPVTVSKSKEQVADLLRRRGIVHTQWTTEPDPTTNRPVHTLRFRITSSEGHALRIRMTVRTPEPRKASKPTRQRTRTVPKADIEGEERRIMRVFYYHLKTLFEATDVGLQRVEELLLAHVEDAGGKTVGEHMRPVLHRLEVGHLHAQPLALTVGGT